MEQKKKIGIMGGTFDPIHLGHLILGEKSYEQLSLDEVWYMPAGNPPHKQLRGGGAADEQRVEMVRLAICDNPHFRLSLMEMNEDGFTYTYRTLEKLRERYPDTEFYFIIGADSLLSFDSWMKPGRILGAAIVVVATRDHLPSPQLTREMDRLTEKYGGRMVLLDTMNIDVSSHMLREWTARGNSLRYYTPDAVVRYIRENRLYQDLP
ncbi:MAG: nicotinate-nucleotide adenylyltransferase [Blautia sp.]|nr:nicotinate-nucleotide adenylyltransferase [Blautia sp.]